MFTDESGLILFNMISQINTDMLIHLVSNNFSVGWAKILRQFNSIKIWWFIILYIWYWLVWYLSWDWYLIDVYNLNIYLEFNGTKQKQSIRIIWVNRKQEKRARRKTSNILFLWNWLVPHYHISMDHSLEFCVLCIFHYPLHWFLLWSLFNSLPYFTKCPNYHSVHYKGSHMDQFRFKYSSHYILVFVPLLQSAYRWRGSICAWLDWE